MGDLAVVITVRDESANLENCLASARPFGEVLVAIDKRSEDGTRQIADKEGCFLHNGLPDDISVPDDEELKQEWMEEQNSALTADDSMARMYNNVLSEARDHTDAEWLMWLDGNQLVQGDPEYLQTILERGDPDRHCGVMVRTAQVNRFGNIGNMWWEPRIIHRSQQLTRRRNCLIDSEQPLLIASELTLQESPRPQQEWRQVLKGRLAPRYSDWQEFKDGAAIVSLIDCWMYQQEWEEALRWAEQGMRLSDDERSREATANICFRAGQVCMQTGRFPEAADWFWNALDYDWASGAAYYYLGLAAAKSNDSPQAEIYFRHALNYPNEPISTTRQPHGATWDMPYHGLARIEESRGNITNAFELLDKAQGINKNRGEYLGMRERLQDKVEQMPDEEGPTLHFPTGEVNIVVGGGMRVGTTWMAEVLTRALHQRVLDEPVILGESGAYNDRTGADWQAQCHEMRKQWTYHILNKPPEAIEQMVALYRQIPERFPSIIGYKDGHPEISALCYPDAKFLIMERATNRAMDGIYSRWGEGVQTSGVRACAPELWDAVVDEVMNWDDWPQNRVEWALYYELMKLADRGHLKHLGVDYKVFDLEDLTGNYQYAWPELIEWLGLDVDANWADFAEQIKLAPNRQPAPTDVTKLHKEIATSVNVSLTELHGDMLPDFDISDYKGEV